MLKQILLLVLIMSLLFTGCSSYSQKRQERLELQNQANIEHNKKVRAEQRKHLPKYQQEFAEVLDKFGDEWAGKCLENFGKK
jgi:outer membrane biogenesis lipoprotein LolB